MTTSNLDPREWDQFVSQAVVKCTGVSNGAVRLEAYDVFKEFFSDSGAWTEDILFSPVAGTTSYDIEPSEGGQIIRLIGVCDGSRSPWAATMREFGTVVLQNAPNTTPADQWTARVVKTICLPTLKDGVPDAPEWALKVYSIHLTDGVLGKLMAQPNKSWSNPTQSTYHLRRFRTGIQISRTAKEHENLVGAQAWAYPRNATAGTQRGSGNVPWPRGM